MVLCGYASAGQTTFPLFGYKQFTGFCLRHLVKAPQCSGGDCGFLNYHTIFIPEYLYLLPEDFYDKIIYYKGLYCTKV